MYSRIPVILILLFITVLLAAVTCQGQVAGIFLAVWTAVQDTGNNTSTLQGPDVIISSDTGLCVAPGDEESSISKGNAYMKQQKFNQAYNAFNQTLQCNPASIEAWYGKAAALQTLWRISKNLADYAGDADDYHGAVLCYREAKTTHPDDPSAWYPEGKKICFQYNQDPEPDDSPYTQGLDAYLTAATQYPQADEGVWYGKGREIYRQNLNAESVRQHEEQFDAYVQIMKIDPRNADVYRVMGNALYDEGKDNESYDAYQQAISRDPENAGAWYGLGNVLPSFKRYDEAKIAHEKALELDPELGNTSWYPRNGCAIDPRNSRAEMCVSSANVPESGFRV